MNKEQLQKFIDLLWQYHQDGNLGSWFEDDVYGICPDIKISWNTGTDQWIIL